MNKQTGRYALALLIVALVAAASCYLTGRLFGWHHADAVRGYTHQRVHQELGLSPEQDRALHQSEDHYSQRRSALAAEIRQANHELAAAVLADSGYSPRVTAAVDRIHRAQGELQKATLEHVFEMRTALAPTQYRRLLELTAQALDPAADGQSPH